VIVHASKDNGVVEGMVKELGVGVACILRDGELGTLCWNLNRHK